MCSLNAAFYELKAHWCLILSFDICELYLFQNISVCEILFCLALIDRCIHYLKVLGFDCEWCNDSGFVRPVSLLQLATVSGLCVLVRLNQFTVWPNSFRELLADNR